MPAIASTSVPQLRISRLAVEPKAQGLVLLGLLLLALLVPKLLLASQQVIKGGDGGYYTNVAMHVAAGHGLKTNLSLMHKGYEFFPHPTSVYPLWPLVQGYAARVIGLHVAGVWLPTLFYFGALAFAYLWASSLFPQPLFPRALPGFNGGHVMVLILGLNAEFFWFTSLPYTEGLAYMLVFGALWRAGTLMRAPSARGGIELGLWLGLAFLTRTQLLIVPIALLCAIAFGLVFMPDRRRGCASMGGAFLAVLAVLVAPYLLHVRSFAPGTGFVELLRFDQTRANDVLKPLDALVRTEGVLSYIADRASGLKVAFSPRGEYSYAQQYHTFQYALLAAIPPAAVWLARRARRAELQAFIERGRSPEALPLLFFAALAVGGLVSIHLMHKSRWAEWNFHIRHALTCSFAFFFSLVFLLRSRSWAFAAGVLVLCTGVLGGTATADKMVDRGTRRHHADDFRPSLVEWINERRAAEGQLTLASRFVQHIWHYTPDVNYHSYFDDTSLEDMSSLFDELGADYLVVPRWVRPSFMRDRGAFRRSFVLVARRNDCNIYRPARHARVLRR